MPDLDNLDFSSGNISEKSEGPTEEDLGSVAENLKKAAQVWGQIKKSQAKNAVYAKLLTLLLQYVEGDVMWVNIGKLLIDFKVDIKDLFGLFYPYLSDKINDNDVISLYDETYQIDKSSISSYTNFIKSRLANDKSLAGVGKDELVLLVTDIMYMFNTSGLDVNIRKDVEKSLQSTLYG